MGSATGSPESPFFQQGNEFQAFRLRPRAVVHTPEQMAVHVHSVRTEGTELELWLEQGGEQGGNQELVVLYP